MRKKTLGMMIASLRKENGMTQLELAEKMGVTDKAVSKWERDLSCPDVHSIPKLAEVFGIRVDELMQIKAESQDEAKKDITPMVHMILKAIALAMGVGVVVLSILKQLDVHSGMGMLGIGLACLAIISLAKKNEESSIPVYRADTEGAFLYGVNPVCALCETERPGYFASLHSEQGVLPLRRVEAAPEDISIAG